MPIVGLRCSSSSPASSSATHTSSGGDGDQRISPPLSPRRRSAASMRDSRLRTASRVAGSCTMAEAEVEDRTAAAARWWPDQLSALPPSQPDVGGVGGAGSAGATIVDETVCGHRPPATRPGVVCQPPQLPRMGRRRSRSAGRGGCAGYGRYELRLPGMGRTAGRTRCAHARTSSRRPS
eukprot:COSAG01_NODE_6090_length_3856_cov_6.761778_5_plen_179_part_00